MAASAIRADLRCGDRSCSCKGERANVHCPAHQDNVPSLSVTEKGSKVLVHCHAGCDQKDVITALREMNLWPKQRGKSGTEQEWRIIDANGKEVARHIRKDYPDGSKTLFWKRNEKLGLRGLRKVDLPLYNLPRLLEAQPGSEVVVTEGEKAADALTKRGILAVGTVTGADSTPSESTLKALIGSKAILWPDNDKVGHPHMNRIATTLWAMGHRHIRIIDWEGAPHKGDAADFNGDNAELAQLINSAVGYKGPTVIDLGILLSEIREFIRRYVVLNDDQSIAVTLWVAHTWTMDAWEVTPYLHVFSPEKRSGKSLLLEVLVLMVANPWFTGRVTPAVLVRKIEREMPTLLLDETDAAFKFRSEYSETLRGVLNAGYQRGGVVSLNVKVGGDWVPKDFSVFSAKAIAGIGQLPDTVADRSIPIKMHRRLRTEAVDRFRRRIVKELAEPLRAQLETWAVGAMSTLEKARPSLPVELDDRSADVWEPLLAIADLAGGKWPDLARRAARQISRSGLREEESLGVRLLQDILTVFDTENLGRLTSATLVEALLSIEDSPWPDIRGKPLDKTKLARLLMPYGISPKSLRFAVSVVRGYENVDFLDAWARYVVDGSSIPAEAATPATGATPDSFDVAPVAPVAGNTGISGADQAMPHTSADRSKNRPDILEIE